MPNEYTDSFPGFHAITGCDYNTAFFKIRKLKPYRIFKKYQEYQRFSMKFGNSKLIEDNDEQQHVFICNVFNVCNIIDVDAAPLQMIIVSYTVFDVKKAFDRKKLQNASSLPCKSELLPQFLLANYICTIWNNIHPNN